MTQYVGFLRGINVGGHNVKMDVLCAEFEALGLANVETFTASGNVSFESRSANTTALEAKIESQLAATLGYEVATFVRTRSEISLLAQQAVFSEAQLASAGAYCVAFIKAPLTVAQAAMLQRFATAVDEFRTVGREIFWLCKVRQSESKFSNAQFERKMGIAATFRNITTVRKLATKYPPR